ncbi:MAG TPA: M20/M25/M40 family metallo-hydrolase, partial [Xanthobacteraceae bacterium]|jgi:allantoate deiminase|nr:M20/M25/M40 family metallo-hydrolase [Xanthobacteraceae bacterium]
MRVTVTGEAGHAGTVPMHLRRDAFAAAAEMALLVEAIANQNHAAAMVATVGRVEVSPGATNIIPARAVFTVDLRCMDDQLRKQAIERFSTETMRIAKARNVECSIEPFLQTKATLCATALQDGLATAISEMGCKPLKLPSGAGHDAQMMAKLCPAAMMFVRCRGGISHNPAEFASSADMGLAIAALIRFIERFDPDRV